MKGPVRIVSAHRTGNISRDDAAHLIREYRHKYSGDRVCKGHIHLYAPAYKGLEVDLVIGKGDGADTGEDVLMSGRPVTGQDLGTQLAKILGLPKYTEWFELRCDATGLATITCSSYPDEAAVSEMLPVINKYKLVEKEQEEGSP